MSIARHHTEWLSLTEVSGPFLSLPVLIRAFPQGLEKVDPALLPQLSAAYEEWREDQMRPGRGAATHQAWVQYVLRTVLGFPSDTIAGGQAIPESLKATVAEHGETLRPNLVIRNANDGNARLLISVYPAEQALGKRVVNKRWSASPETRMTELLHATGVRLGLVTNGEQWMVVDAPRDDTAGFASWYSGLWFEERITLQSFRSLFGASRFFGAADADTPEALLAESAQNQQEVTTQLGYQVRRAVEVLIDAFDRSDQDQHRTLLVGVGESEIYEASLTVMMRLVFLFCAEERELLLLGDPLFDQHYAVSPLREQLREAADQHGEEVLERRHDAWSRLLATFRAVHGGVRHERMTIPPYGGTLFDPDRFPFLEGRVHGTTWRNTSADPVPVDNRTVLHLLEALQLLQVRVPGGGPAEARRLSFRALDIEQIGHVYEGLLDHTAKRATETTLSLTGTRSKAGDTEPEVPISKLEELAGRGRVELVKWVCEQTGRSAKTIEKLLDQRLTDEDEQRFQVACGSGEEGEMVWRRVRPFASLVRENSFGHPLVIHAGNVHVTAGTDRRSTGTQYTPRSLTEPIVRHTLEPLVYAGPAEGKPREEWKLRSPRELLDLKICDFACGSGAFLVQACRSLSERVREAWEELEASRPDILRITPEGEPSVGLPEERLIPKDRDERVTYAMRLVAQRCLYGVDINPLAVEMAKLSMWLLTLSRDQPFTFLDHAIRCGDSLFGITRIEQLKRFSLTREPVQRTLSQTETFDKLIETSIVNRLRLETIVGATVADVEAQERLLAEADGNVTRLKAAADWLLAAEMQQADRETAVARANEVLVSPDTSFEVALQPNGIRRSRPFHWPLEFPEVIERRQGFDAFIGNPPFVGGRRIRRSLGNDSLEWLAHNWPHASMNADYCAFFFLRAASLLTITGTMGLLATKTIAQGDTARTGLQYILEELDVTLYLARTAFKWPGSASVVSSLIVGRRGSWVGPRLLDGREVALISAVLDDKEGWGAAFVLPENVERSFQGSVLVGKGFVVSAEEAQEYIRLRPTNTEVLRPYLSGDDLNSDPEQLAGRWAIDFRDKGLEQCEKLWPELLERVRLLVKPQRDIVRRDAHRKYWWHHGDKRPELYMRISRRSDVFVIARVTKYVAIVAVRADQIFHDKVYVFDLDGFGQFAVLQSSFHDIWVRRGSSTVGETLNYTPSDYFDTFPFLHLDQGSLEEIGRDYHEHRKNVMKSKRVGLTDTYNLFHDRNETTGDIQMLRDLHVKMDQAVAAAYGWSDFDLGHDFHQMKQGVRFTISEAARGKVLDLLLHLNHKRHAEGGKQGLDRKGATKKAGRKRAATFPSVGAPTLFDQDES